VRAADASDRGKNADTELTAALRAAATLWYPISAAAFDEITPNLS
jgi:hypothetical protein